MNATDTRPAAGWSDLPDGRVAFVQHDTSFFDLAPKREGFEPMFVARHGRSWTRWTYKPVTAK